MSSTSLVSSPVSFSISRPVSWIRRSAPIASACTRVRRAPSGSVREITLSGIFGAYGWLRAMRKARAIRPSIASSRVRAARMMRITSSMSHTA